MEVRLAYGETPRTITVGDGSRIVRAPARLANVDLADALETALENPIGSPRLDELASSAKRVLIVVSDSTRHEPRAEMLEALRRQIPSDANVRIAVANGTHPPQPLDALELPRWAQPTVNHDSRNPSNIVDIGTTSRGTPIRLNRAATEADLIIATGAIRPHYFAGFGGGVKAVFPGLGENAAIRTNHELKAAPRAVAGNVSGNPCRDDLEESLAAIPCPSFLLNVVEGPGGQIEGAVAGHVIYAHRAGTERCRPLFSVTAERASTIVVSDSPPITRSLYQACKLIAAAAPIAMPGGTIIVAAECDRGIGATGEAEVVNRAIFELGIRPRLPTECKVVVVSTTLAERAAELFCEVWTDFHSLEKRTCTAIPENGASLLLRAA